MHAFTRTFTHTIYQPCDLLDVHVHIQLSLCKSGLILAVAGVLPVFDEMTPLQPSNVCSNSVMLTLLRLTHGRFLAARW